MRTEKTAVSHLSGDTGKKVVGGGQKEGRHSEKLDGRGKIKKQN